MPFVCQYCDRSFVKENTLVVHVCEPKRRHQEQKEVGVQLGLRAYLRFYEISQGSAKSKTFNDFASSSFYRAFVKFGRHIQAIRAVNPPRFIDWVVRQNKKIDNWCKDSVYTEYLSEYLRIENVTDALTRAIEEAQLWQEKTQNPLADYLRYGNDNALCYAVSTGRVSAWVLYNCDSGNEFLARINPEQVAMIWPCIDADFWSKKFKDYPADVEHVREILKHSGW
jgi:hypothetical protein